MILGAFRGPCVLLSVDKDAVPQTCVTIFAEAFCFWCLFLVRRRARRISPEMDGRKPIGVGMDPSRSSTRKHPATFLRFVTLISRHRLYAPSLFRAAFVQMNASARDGKGVYYRCTNISMAHHVSMLYPEGDPCLIPLSISIHFPASVQYSSLF